MDNTEISLILKRSRDGDNKARAELVLRWVSLLEIAKPLGMPKAHRKPRMVVRSRVVVRSAAIEFGCANTDTSLAGLFLRNQRNGDGRSVERAVPFALESNVPRSVDRSFDNK